MKFADLVVPFVALFLAPLVACSSPQQDDATENGPTAAQADADESSKQEAASSVNEVVESPDEAAPLDDSKLETLTIVTVDNPGREAVYATPSDGYEPPRVSLRIVRSERNDITDIDRWWSDHPADRRTELPLGAPETVEGEQFRYASGLDLAVVMYGAGHDQRYLWAEHADGPPTFIDLAALKERWMSLTYADRRGDTIFLAHSTRSSAEAMNGHNGYVIAIDAWTGEVLWQSEPLVANSLNFEIIDGVLISGYGFTAEDDFLYALDIATGRVLTRLPIRKMAEYLSYDGETLFVRTYDRDLEVRLEIERP